MYTVLKYQLKYVPVIGYIKKISLFVPGIIHSHKTKNKSFKYTCPNYIFLRL